MLGGDLDRTRAVWWTAAVALFASVAFVVYSFVGTFVFGLFVYYATRPVYRRVRRRVGQPTVSAALALTAFTLPGVLLLAYAVAIALKELRRLDSTALGPLGSAIEPYVDLSGLV